jgi:hypothetical protein
MGHVNEFHDLCGIGELVIEKFLPGWTKYHQPRQLEILQDYVKLGFTILKYMDIFRKNDVDYWYWSQR